MDNDEVLNTEELDHEPMIEEESDEELEDGEEQEDDVEEEGSDEPYTPTLKYKVKDKEFEFDPRLKDVIKSKKDEEYFRDLYTKAAGLDTYKSRSSELENQAKQLLAGYTKLQEMRDQKQYDKLASALGLNEEAIIDMAAHAIRKKDEEAKLTPAEKQMREELAQVKSQLNQYQSQSKQYGETLRTKEVENDITSIQNLAKSKEYSPIANAMKSVGLDMFNEVVQAGIYLENTGQEPDIRDVVDLVAKKYSYLLKTNKQPTLPKMKGSNSQAVGKTITSLDQLRELAKTIKR